MIEKMKFVSITGPKEDIDRVTEEHLSKYEIHLENALTELNTAKTLTPYIEINPYKEEIRKAEELTSLLPPELRDKKRTVTLEQALNLIHSTDEPLAKLRKEKEDYLAERKTYQDLAELVSPFRDLPAKLSTLTKFSFIRPRFGRIPLEFYTKFENYIYENTDSIFYRCHSDAQYVWGVYFTPKNSRRKTDAAYTSLHFERIYMPDTLKDTPEEEYNANLWKVQEMDVRISQVDAKMEGILSGRAESLNGAQETLSNYSRNFDIRKLAACTKTKNETFYILCGWMSAEDAASFQAETKDDPNIFCIIEDDDVNPEIEPPTKLRNPKIFRPFEMFVRMYGLPKYDEFDPTIYVALTYSFIFGIMFGDVGQGLCFVIGGFLIYHFRHADLAAIMGSAGIFSVIWGFVYNSFFGFEDFFPYKALIHAKDDMMNLPGLGSMNTVFVLSVAFGMIMILINMVMGIINAVRQKNKENTWFSQNALAGIIFYGTIVVMMFLKFSGTMGIHQMLPFILIPLIASLAVIFLKEMLARIASHRKPAIEGSKGMYFTQAFFETFETLLTYLSNTLSYVRVGAYAVSHVAMMQVVMMLSGFESGSGNVAGLIVGELFVMAMEGLMVAIQVLRLEYYEMFSRFYQGGGREFRPFIKNRQAGK